SKRPAAGSTARRVTGASAPPRGPLPISRITPSAAALGSRRSHSSMVKSPAPTLRPLAVGCVRGAPRRCGSPWTSAAAKVALAQVSGSIARPGGPAGAGGGASPIRTRSASSSPRATGASGAGGTTRSARPKRPGSSRPPRPRFRKWPCGPASLRTELGGMPSCSSKSHSATVPARAAPAQPTEQARAIARPTSPLTAGGRYRDRPRAREARAAAGLELDVHREAGLVGPAVGVQPEAAVEDVAAELHAEAGPAGHDRPEDAHLELALAVTRMELLPVLEAAHEAHPEAAPPGVGRDRQLGGGILEPE